MHSAVPYSAETRELTYFVAVAEELHFGRAAERLGMAQPPLSRAIATLERRMGVSLVDRTSRSVRLTASGSVLLVEARRALAAVAAATQRARQAADENRRLRVATKPEGDAGLLEHILPRYRADPAAIAVEIVVCGTGEAGDMLRDGRVDVAFLHTPHDDFTGFDGDVLLTQPQVAVLPRDHRLANRSALTLAELDDEPLPLWPRRRARDDAGPEARDPGQLMALVALGQVVAVVPRSVRRLARSDVACVPVTDAPVTEVVLSWPREMSSPQLTAFREAAATAAAIPHPVAS